MSSFHSTTIIAAALAQPSLRDAARFVSLAIAARQRGEIATARASLDVAKMLVRRYEASRSEVV